MTDLVRKTASATNGGELDNDNAQTIEGNKTFSADVTISGTATIGGADITAEATTNTLGLSKKFDSEVYAYGGQDGYGSTATKTVRFVITGESTAGTALTLATTAANGTTVTVNQDGIYACHVRTRLNGGSTSFLGLSRNQDGATSASAAPIGDVICSVTADTASEHHSISGTMRLTSGDILRVIYDGSPTIDTTGPWNYVGIRITHIGD